VLSIYLNFYNSCDGLNGLKSITFLALMQFCERLERLDIMIEKMRLIHRDSAGWKMTTEEKRHLLKEVSHALDRVNDPQAFNVTKHFLSDFTAQQSAELEKEAHRCVILAVKARDMITFEELRDIPAINHMQNVSQFIVLTLTFSPTKRCKNSCHF
jgi:hypothetical protein